jgi:hypothetical protein
VRLGVAADAVGRRGEVQRPRIHGAGDAGVALQAINASNEVCAMLERMRRARAMEPEDARAGGDSNAENRDQRQPRFHGTSKARDTRRRASAS